MASVAAVTMKLIASGVGRFRRDMDDAAESVDDVGKAAKRTGDRSADARRKMDGMRDSAAKWGKRAVFAGTAAAGAIGLFGVKAAAAREQSQIAFTTMLGDGEKAKSFLDELQTFASNTPFDLQGVTDSAQRLLAMGFSAKEVLPTLTAAGDAAAGLGGDPETLNGIVTALGQMRAKGKITAEEMNQLTERGVPAWELLAKSMGVSIPEAMDQVSKSAVSADKGIAALTAGMEKNFGGMMEKQSKTVSGMWANIQDSASVAAMNLMTPFMPAIASGMKKMADLLGSEEFQKKAMEIGKVLADGFQAVLTVIGKVLVKGAEFIRWLTGGTGGAKAMRIALGAVVGALTAMFVVSKVIALMRTFRLVILGVNLAMQANPAVRLAAIIGGLIGVIITAYHESATFRNVVQKMGTIAVNVWKGIRKWVQAVVDKVQAVIDKAKEALSWLEKIDPRNWFGGGTDTTYNQRKIEEWQSNQVMSGNPTPSVRAIGGNAAGGMIERGGNWTWVGERGPELVRLPTGSKVTPSTESRMGSSHGQEIVIHSVLEVSERELARIVKRVNLAQAARA